jgi:hypothetical protein
MLTFIGHESWRGEFQFPETKTHFEKMASFYGKVEILRPLLWFYVGQKNVKVEDLSKWFTDGAIFTMINDHFIKVEELDKEGKIANNG